MIFRYILVLLLFVSSQAAAQSMLQLPVTVQAHNQPLEKVLDTISKQGRFVFSYNGNLIKGDSLVTLSVKSKTVKQVLDLLFNETLQYTPSGNYLILQKADFPANSTTWYISGYVQDAVTGEKINNASVYEQTHLVGTITNEEGFFRLRLKEKYNYPPTIDISISRVAYADTSVTIHSGRDNQLSIAIKPVSAELSPLIIRSKIEKGWMAQLFITPAQSIQSMNLRNFFANKPIQFSLTPGLGTHGNMSTQVVNKFSFNVLGGYTAGTKGLEIAGLFNINKKDASYVQVAGLSNTVGRRMNGLQVAGINNHVVDSVKGLQVAGIINTTGAVEGMQVAGITNITDSNVSGFQIAGIANIVKGEVKGFQAAGIFNRTRHMKGFQVGLVNVSDTLSGYSLALLTIAKNGYHKMLVYNSSLLDVNFAYKAGNKKLYSLIMGGASVGNGRKVYGYGYGLGTEIAVGKRISIIQELANQHLYNGTWQEIYSYRPVFQWMISKKLSLYGGPVLYVGDIKTPVKGYASIAPDHHLFSSNGTLGWLGWQAGIQLF